MKSIILSLCLLTTIVSCGQKKDKMFLDKVLNDYSRDSYFVVLKTKTANRTATSLIDNDDLYFYFHEKKGFDKKAYKEFMTSFLNQVKVLELSKSDYDKYGFNEVRKDQSIDADVSKGKDFFLNKYFKNQVIIDGFTREKKTYIIKVLYDWEVATKIDDESGYLVMSK